MVDGSRTGLEEVAEIGSWILDYSIFRWVAINGGESIGIGSLWYSENGVSHMMYSIVSEYARCSGLSMANPSID